MALELPGFSIIGRRAKGRLIARQDILKFADFNLQIITASGVPQGEHEVGSLFFNGFDRNLYISTNYKTSNMPDLAWYKCNDLSGVDFSGNKKDLTVTGATKIAGKYGTAFNMDGSNDKLEIPADVGFTFNTDWTWEAWLYIPSATWGAGDIIYLFERYVDATHYFIIEIDFDAGEDIIVRWNNGGGETVENMGNGNGNGDLIATDEWFFLAIDHDTSGNILHALSRVDSSSIFGDYGNDGANLPNISFTTEKFEVGHSQKDSDYGENFYIDEIKLWNKERGEQSTGIYPVLNGNNTLYTDSLNLDINNWASYVGLPAKAV